MSRGERLLELMNSAAVYQTKIVLKRQDRAYDGKASKTGGSQ
jgi:hypothetical protein